MGHELKSRQKTNQSRGRECRASSTSSSTSSQGGRRGTVPCEEERRKVRKEGQEEEEKPRKVQRSQKVQREEEEEAKSESKPFKNSRRGESPRGSGAEPRQEKIGEKPWEKEEIFKQPKFDFIRKYRQRSSESEEDVPGNSPVSAGEDAEESQPSSPEVPDQEAQQFFGERVVRGVSRSRSWKRTNPALRGRVEDQRSSRTVSRTAGGGSPEGHREDGLHRHGGHGGLREEVDPEDGPLFPPGTFTPNIWSYGPRTPYPLQCDRRLAGWQCPASAGYQSPAHQGSGVTSGWHLVPGVAEAGGGPHRGVVAPLQTGDFYHTAREEPGDQGLRWDYVSAPSAWQREAGSERRSSVLQGQGCEGQGQNQGRQQEDGGLQEGRRRPSCVIAALAGAGTPDMAGSTAITMREFFPRYHGPLVDKNVFVCTKGPQVPSVELGSATSAATATRGVFPEGHGSSAHGPKEPPLGLRLGQMGELVKNRFLEVLLHSQSTGKGISSLLFPLPTSRDRISSFLSKARSEDVDWVVAICLALNSYWGGPLFNDKEPHKCQFAVLESFLHDVQRLSEIQDTVDEFDWKEFFKCRTIDYKGDEVKTAKSFCWGHIGPTLPQEIGVVQLTDLCEQGCRYYIEHFPEFLKPEGDWPIIKNARVMVSDSDWPEVADNLVKARVCKVIPESEVFKVRGVPLLNGLFGVEKGEDRDGIPLYRLIMNLVPLNSICLGLSADIAGLPHWLGMNPFALEPHEGMLVSSEDVRCFFYTLGLPSLWMPYLAFNRAVPDVMKPRGCDEPCYLASVVLPMGFINSVGIAQHVHRVLVSRSSPLPPLDLHSREIKKDLPLPSGSSAWRVYLDNYDLLEKFPKETLVEHQGTLASDVEGLRGSYADVGMPRHPGKSVTRQPLAEVQGAMVDGLRGVAYPKGSKLAKYVVMALKFCQLGQCSQRQVQVICGGLVYFTMFRRAILGSLNQCWEFIESFNQAGRHHLTIPGLVKLEILRCVCLVGLCRMDFRLPMKSVVTCSDASTTGGGMCCSTGLSPAGAMVALGDLRPVGNPLDSRPKILSVGLFDGIGCLRVALDLVGANVAGHISVEKQIEGHRVVEYHFPGSIMTNDVAVITDDDVRGWSLRFGQVDLVLLGAGPPCQGVSGLNASRRGALLDERSNLFIHVDRVRKLLTTHFAWCPTHVLMESVASMDESDKSSMSSSFGDDPWEIDSEFMTWCRRPRLYWTTWGLAESDGVQIEDRKVFLSSALALADCLTPGWNKCDPDRAFPTFTTSRPRTAPGHRPAGIHHCDPETIKRWEADLFRYPPYQYLPANCLVNKRGDLRLPNIEEKEFMMGLPIGYTSPCLPKSQRKSAAHQDLRHTLVGNAWCVPVVSWLVGQLLGPLGLGDNLTPQGIVDRLDPSKTLDVRSRLTRRMLRAVVGTTCELPAPGQLENLLSRLVSAKGEDILISSSTDQVNAYQRLRQTVPARLWKWKVISGWKWRRGKEHINCLEMRALEATLRWRIERLGDHRCKIVHLTDSLVCLHTVSRGRSSSKKLRRCVCRLNALLLASGVAPVWGYVHTDQNPADKPSRWAVRTKFKHAKARA